MPPLRLFVGGDELPELKRQSEEYAEAASNQQLPVKLAMLPRHHHFSILDELAMHNGRITVELRELVSTQV
jgi:arylformamidase